MKLRNLKVFFIAAVLSIMCSFTCEAATDSGTYMELMSSDYSYMYTRAQPNDALVLQPFICISGTVKSRVNLPRLTHSFYYNIKTDNPDITLEVQPYPCLVFNASEIKDKFSLTIYSADTNNSICTVDILVDAVFEESANLAASLDFSKISQDEILNFDTQTTYYNPLLHEYGLVTNDHLYLLPSVASLDTWLNAELSINDGTLISNSNENTIDMMEYEGTLEVQSLKYRYSRTNPEIEVDLGSVLSSRLTSGTDIIAWFSDDSIERTDVNTYTQKTQSTTGGNYWYACNDILVVTDVSNTTTLTDEQLSELESNPEITLASLLGDTLNLTTLSDYHVAFQNVATRDVVSSSIVVDSDSIYNGLGFYGGISPATIAINVTNSYTLHFDTNDSDLVCYVNEQPVLPTPTKAYFTFDGWFIDKELTTQFDYTKHGIANTTVNLYAKWVYNGGYYTVRFVDTFNNTTDTVTVKTIEQPELPTNPTRTGYGFSHWLIVESPSDITGVKYSPETFTPSSDYTYIFSAQFAVKGIITNIEKSNATYYVGQTFDKSTLKVTVQTDDDGTKKVLSASEYSVSPSTFSSSGKKTLTITYTATGATATTDITVLEDSITSISAVYTGSTIVVGNSIPTSDINVTAKFASGNEATVKGFSIYPTTVRSVGSNTITVSYGALSTTINVSGVSATTSNNSKKLTALSASYNGKDVYVGDNLLSSSFTVTATYSDGSKEVLPSSKFSFTPSYMSKAGSNTIVISYGGLSCQATVYVKENDNTSSTSVNSSKNTPTSSTDTNNTSSNTTSNGTSATIAKDKTTSVGYLNGSNILTMLTSSSNASVAVNTINISDIIEDASDSAEIPITLVNLAEDSFLSDDDINAIRKKNLHLTISMKDADTDKIVGIWDIDGEYLTTESSAFNLSVYQTEVPKASETMYVFYVDDVYYTEGINCRIYLPDAFPQGEYVSLYSCDAQLANSFCITKFLWEADSISLPLEHAPNYVITNNRMNYANGSDLTQELVNDSVEEENASEELEEESTVEEITDNFEYESPSVPESPKKKGTSKLLWLVIIAVILLVVLGLSFAQFIKRRTTEDDFSEENDEDTEYFEE